MADDRVKGPDQGFLFDITPPWVKHWVGMPEFSHEDLEPYRTLLLHFDTEDDLGKFCKLVDQNVTPDTKSIWYPELEITRLVDKRYAPKGAS